MVPLSNPKGEVMSYNSHEEVTGSVPGTDTGKQQHGPAHAHRLSWGCATKFATTSASFFSAALSEGSGVDWKAGRR